MSLVAEKQQPFFWCLGMFTPLSEGSRRIKQVSRSQKWRRKVVVKQLGPNIALLLSSVFHHVFFSCFPVFCPAVL